MLVLSPFVRQRLTMIIAKQRHADMETLAQLVESGGIRPVVGAVYPLAEAPEAVRQLAAGQARGKIVLTV
jgi:NADPH:quinone reductase-like Zn-dependent oxidoreductase